MSQFKTPYPEGPHNSLVLALGVVTAVFVGLSLLQASSWICVAYGQILCQLNAVGANLFQDCTQSELLYRG